MSRSPFLALEGVKNIRDLGGLPTDDGRIVRCGVLYRSEVLREATAEDVRVLRDEIGLRTLLDLRLEGEVDQDGRGLLEETLIAYHHLPLTAESMAEGETVPDIREIELVSHYLTYLPPSMKSIAGVFHLLAQSDTLPAMLHCSAGKDRTGVVAALLLTAIGVREEEVVRDYARSELVKEDVVARLGRLPSFRGRLHLLPPHALASEERTMRNFLAQMRERHGGVRAWLSDADVDEQTLNRLADLLLEPAADPQPG